MNNEAQQQPRSTLQKIVLATTNKGKVKEFKEMLEPLGYNVVSLADEGISVDIVEDGDTFEENAHIKAEAIYAICKCHVIADDSGLEIDFLNGAPGIFSARYAGENATDKVRCAKILEEMQFADEPLRTARFVCAIYCILDDETEYCVRGTLEGYIGTEPMGDNGFGYDPIFMVDDENSVAMLSSDEKNKISHRANALSKLVDILNLEK